MSGLLKVALGGINFELHGLDEEQQIRLRAAWGPFVLDLYGAPESGETRSLWADLIIHFIYAPRPSEVRPHFARGADLSLVFMSDQMGRGMIQSWVDGSLGSLEATLQVVLQWTLAREGGLLVHASAGVYQGQGWLIPGVSGAGKSTAVRGGGFDLVLSDEMVIVRVDQKRRYRLYSTPFWSEGRTSPLTVADASLDLIAFPLKATYAQLLPCASSEAVSRLLRAVTAYERSAGEESSQQQSAQLFESACRLVESTSQRVLAFPKRGPWRALLSHPRRRDRHIDRDLT